MRLKFILLSILFLSCSYGLQAKGSELSDTLSCEDYSCCSKDDPSPAGIMISHVHRKNEWMLSYKYMSMGMNGNMEGENEISKEAIFSKYTMSADAMQMDMDMMMLMYGVSNRFTLMGMLNYIRNMMDMSMFSSGHTHGGMQGSGMSSEMTSSGLGDAKLYLIYGAILKSNQQLIISGGLNFPAKNPSASLVYSMQCGSGTYDFLPLINYLYQENSICFSTQISSNIRLGNNSLGYNMGNDFTSNTWLAWQWSRMMSTSIRMEGILSDRIQGRDMSIYYYDDITSNPMNYGGRRLNMFVGSVFNPKKTCMKNLHLSFEYGIPVYQYLNGIQMKATHSLLGTCSWSF